MVTSSAAIASTVDDIGINRFILTQTLVVREERKTMSSPIHCPNCNAFVTETGWGDEEGHYECPECDEEFTVGDPEPQDGPDELPYMR